MPTQTRRHPMPLLLALALLGGVLPSALAPAAVAATEDPALVAPEPDLTIEQAEAEILRLINADRTAIGLVPVRADARLMAMARARSEDMIANDYFSHQQPDGRNVFDLIAASGMTWYLAGEIIAWNNYPGLALSAAGANSAWLGSPGHRAIIESVDFNYVGVGVALNPETGRKMWTGVFLRGPDRTPGWSSLRAPRVTAGTRIGRRTVTLRWSGADTRLQVLTAGVRTFQVQRRVGSGAWRTIAWTRNTSLRLSQRRGHRYTYRVRTIDRAGNVGSWSTVRVRI